MWSKIGIENYHVIIFLFLKERLKNFYDFIVHLSSEFCRMETFDPYRVGSIRNSLRDA